MARKNEKKKTLRVPLGDEQLSAVTGGSRTRQKLEAAELRMSNDAVAAFIEGFLSTAPV